MTSGAIRLRCNDLVDPVGIAPAKPRFSWQLPSLTERGHRQTAYRIQVATREAMLFDGRPDLWDSGVVPGNRTHGVEYDGKALDSEEHIHWRVCYHDERGHASPWSRPATFTTGLAAWGAPWIEAPATDLPTNFRWIWHPGGPSAHWQAEARTCRFTHEITLPDEWKTQGAHALFLLHASVDVQVGAHQVTLQKMPTIQRISLPGGELSGKVTITIIARHEGDGPAGIAGRFVIASADGRQMVVALDRTWNVDDTQAEELCQYGETDPWGKPLSSLPLPDEPNHLVLAPVVTLRKEFQFAGGVRHAYLHITALGIATCRVNGEAVAEDCFTPGWSDYAQRVYSRTYDVAKLLHAGTNVIEVDLAEGWFAGYVAWGHRRSHHQSDPKLRAQLTMIFPDGTSRRVYTDNTWQSSNDGPVREADILMGEHHDARLVPTKWRGTLITWPPLSVAVEPYPCEPVTPQELLKPISITEPQPGCHVFDLGQNMVGVYRLRVTGPVGTKITLRFAEVLKDDGTVYTEALRGARCTDTYIKGTNDEETWTPRFTYHGFRYVQVAGLAETPSVETLTGVVLHNHRENHGDFSSSSTLLNQLWSNIRWGWKGNSLEVPTDCPQRDERAGWTGDAFVFSRTAMYLERSAAFWAKWLDALFDGQTPQGFFPCVAPQVDTSPNPLRHNAGWDDAAIMVPYTLWRVYDDLHPIRKHWGRMRGYIRYMETLCVDCIYPEKEIFGDWLSLNAQTPAAVMGTAFFAQDVRQMAELAGALGDAEASAEYTALFEKIRTRFIERFVAPDGKVFGHTQTCYVLALRVGLLPEGLRAAAVDHLKRDLEYRGRALSCGFMGLRDLLPALSDAGRDDLAYDLALREEFPGWGYQIMNGATTIWERWDGWTREMGLQDPGMNSFNHYSLGAVGQWMMGYIGGIESIEPGFRRFRIRPHLDGRLSQVNVRAETIHGAASCAWSQRGGPLSMVCRVPSNTTAEIWIPRRGGELLRESNLAIADAKGLELLSETKTHWIVSAQPGHYAFSVV